MKLEKMEVPISEYIEVSILTLQISTVVIGMLVLGSANIKFLWLFAPVIVILFFICMGSVVKIWWNNFKYEREKKRNVVFALYEFLRETRSLFPECNALYHQHLLARTSLLERLGTIQNIDELSVDMLVYLESKLNLLQESAKKVRNTENIALANVYIKMLQTSEQQLCVLIDRWMEEQIDKLKSEEEAWSQVLQNTGVIHQKEIPFVDRKIECSGHQ